MSSQFRSHRLIDSSLAAAVAIPDTRVVSTSILDDEDMMFAVVVNHEEQYSIWPADREPPEGWRRVGAPGKKAECLRRIEEVWTDMRPLSLRPLQ
jgi:MbtH protein